MRIFPTKILLATDGSKDAELAASTAIDLANKTGSEREVSSNETHRYLDCVGFGPGIYGVC